MFAFIRRHPYLTATAIFAGVAAIAFPPAAIFSAGSAAYSASAVVGGFLVSAAVFAGYGVFKAFNWVIQGVSRYLFPPSFSLSPQGVTIQNEHNIHNGRPQNRPTGHVVDLASGNFFGSTSPENAHFTLLMSLQRRSPRSGGARSVLDEDSSFRPGETKKTV